MYYQNPFYYNQPAMNQQANLFPTQMSPTSDERIWVQGEDSAKAYLVAPNSFVRLWDSQTPVFYEKRADPTGRPYMETFEYSRKGSNQPNPLVGQGSIQEDRLNALEARISALEEAKKNDE